MKSEYSLDELIRAVRNCRDKNIVEVLFEKIFQHSISNYELITLLCEGCKMNPQIRKKIEKMIKKRKLNFRELDYLYLEMPIYAWEHGLKEYATEETLEKVIEC